MPMKRILITGGAGFIGSALVRRILSDRDFTGSVLNVDKLTYAANLRALESVASDPRYHFSKTDIADLAEIRRLFADFGPDIVIHLAAETHVDRSIDAPFEFVRTNVLGTCNLLEAALSIASKRDEFRFIHVSTDEVYGSISADKSAKEGDVYRPNSPYSASKASSDHLARAWHVTYGLPVIVTNCTNNYGPWQYPEKLIPVVILNALHDRPLPVYGDGGNVRDWIYVEDHAQALWLVARTAEAGTDFNIGGGAERSNLEVVQQICAVLDELKPRAKDASYADLIEFVPDRPGHDRRYSLDSARIEATLGWRPSVSFEKGIRKTVEWYLENLDELKLTSQSAFAKRRGLRR
jgi:dTDP-glucose 4,6-dehydratase